MKIYILFLSCFLIWACSNTQKSKLNANKNPLLAQFSWQNLKKDTIKFATSQEAFWQVDTSKFKVIPDSLLSKNVQANLIEDLNFTGYANYMAGNKYSLDDSTIACVVYTTDNWFKKISLLLYNNNRNQFYKVLPLAQFYGGEGGLEYQIAWLYKKAKTPYLFYRNVSVSFGIMAEESDAEPIERRNEFNSLQKWEKGAFVEEALQDSARFCSRFVHKVD